MNSASTQGTGVETRSPVVAVIASTAVHVIIAAVLVSMGITAARAMRREAPPVLVADWTPPPPPGVAPAAPELPVPGGAPAHAGPASRLRTDAASAARAAAGRMDELLPAMRSPEGAAPRLVAGLGFGSTDLGSARADGFSTGRSRVAIIVDAGGRLLGALPLARTAVAQRLAALGPDQRFVLAVARGSGTELAPGTPAVATRANVVAALDWFTRNAAPGGTADLQDAVARAWTALEPDAVCLVSRGAPASRRPAARPATAGLEAAAERLNAPGPDGRRPARWLCVELAEPGADGALRRIGERHGGTDGYLLLAPASRPPTRPGP
jgi:hypothetical protein